MIVLGDQRLTIRDIENIVFNGEKIKISPQAEKKVEKCFNFLENFSKDKIIYGITTGFGPMAQYRISDENRIKLQYNLIRSHASGSGELISEHCVKAAMTARLNTLLQARSGVNLSVVRLLEQFINNDIYPNIYKHGGVGASGDLVQLSHLALALIGEGKVKYKGVERNTADVLNELGLKPIEISIREGLALINGTSVMTGISMINIIKAERLLNHSLMISTLINEMVQSYDDHFSAELNCVKHHTGQMRIAQAMRKITETSGLIRKRHEHLYNGKKFEQVFEERVQEYYSMRCLPQVLGPIFDTIVYSKNILENEVNSVNDNPVIDPESENVWHGGNFHGDYVALEADKLKIAVTKLSILAERQLNFLMNDKLNKILPPFANLGILGLNLGMQGAQFSAVSTVAENQTLANPVSIHSIPNNNDNQDIVSMGTNASLITHKIINNTFEVLAIELLSVVQGIDFLGTENKLSDEGKKYYRTVRELVPRFTEDEIMYTKLEKVKNYLKSTHNEYLF